MEVEEGVEIASTMEVDSVPEVKVEADSLSQEYNAKVIPPTCYCGKDRTVGEVEIQCWQCHKFYHYDCLTCSIAGTAIPFMTNYVFLCKPCNPLGAETYSKKTASFTQMSVCAIANLTHIHRHRRVNPTLFSKDREIIPFIDKNWENLTNMPRRIKLSWHNTVVKAMMKETDVFVCNEENPGDPLFGFSNTDLSVIGPSFEATRLMNAAVKEGQKIGPILPDALGKTRNYKRRLPPDPNNPVALKLKKCETALTTRVPLSSYPIEYPLNKDGYRYILAEIDPHSPHLQTYDESQDSAGKPIPGCLYRKYEENVVLLALHDRAPQIKITDDRLSVTGEKGYSMVRASHGVSCGSWYYEVKVDDLPENTATRIGWSQPLGNLQAPCGYDKFSYSWRSKKGTIFHHSRGKHYSAGYKRGDVLGFHIYLPKPTDPSKLLPDTCKDMPLVKFKSHLYYEEKDQVTEAEKLLVPCVGSSISMYKNGRAYGVAYTDIYEGIYHPTISLYKGAAVTANFGPKFKYPPRDLEYEPMCKSSSKAIVERSLREILYHIDNEGKLLEF